MRRPCARACARCRSASCSLSPTRTSYLIYTILATLCFPEIKQMFDDEVSCDHWDDNDRCVHLRQPIKFCVPSRDRVNTDDTGSVDVNAEYDAQSGLQCMDGTFVGLIASVLSILALLGIHPTRRVQTLLALVRVLQRRRAAQLQQRAWQRGARGARLRDAL
eukprot:25714-Prymnesium_polylepis.1